MRFQPPFLAAILLISCHALGQTVTDSDLVITPFAEGLSAPTQIRFLPGGQMLVAQQNGAIKIAAGNTSSTLIDLAVSTDGDERGLLGMTLHPDFANNPFVYVYYSVPTGSTDNASWVENRLSRFTFNGTALVNEEPLRRFGEASDGQAIGTNHNAGPMTFGPDGKLYGTTGDLNRRRAEQNVQAQATASAFVGGIYRLNDDGTPAPGNPFTASPTEDFDPWFAYGVRNSFGIAVDPATGNIWDTENGPESYDEINLVAPGFNSGWVQLMGPLSRNANDLDDLVGLPGSSYSDPEFSFFNTVAVTGLSFLPGSILGAEYDDAVIVGDANNGNLYLFRLNAARNAFVLDGALADLVADSATERDAVEFGSGFGAVTDIQVGPDGAVYVTSIGNGIVYRIVPEPSTTLALAALLLFACRRARHDATH